MYKSIKRSGRMYENPLSHILEYNLDLGKTKPDTVHRDEKVLPLL